MSEEHIEQGDEKMTELKKYQVEGLEIHIAQPKQGHDGEPAMRNGLSLRYAYYRPCKKKCRYYTPGEYCGMCSGFTMAVDLENAVDNVADGSRVIPVYLDEYVMAEHPMKNSWLAIQFFKEIEDDLPGDEGKDHGIPD